MYGKVVEYQDDFSIFWYIFVYNQYMYVIFSDVNPRDYIQ